MKRKILGLFIVIIGLVFMGCPNPITDTPDQAITLLAIPGIVAPARDATPVTTAIDTAQYTGTIAWAGSPATFASTTAYTAIIILTAKVGWTFIGVATNSFTVVGATSMNAPNSGTVVAEFPGTDPAPIALMAIPGVVAPARGATPVTTAIDTAQYTGTIAWAGSPATFAATTVYTAIIVLTAKAGWTLTGVAANSFTVTGATVTNALNSGTVVAEFPATFATAILTMVTVPSGTFQRDSTATNISTISTAYQMSVCEITMEQFVAVTGLANPSVNFTGVVNGPVQRTNWYHTLVFCNKLSIAEGLTPVYTIRSSTVPDVWDGMMDGIITVPTGTDVIWDAAVCNWCANGYRLPTEMEWMWAAMGATSDRSNGYTGTGINTTGYTKGYAGSMETAGAQVNIGNYAWYNLNGSSTTHPVGTAGTTGYPNELGLFDMSGNIWEWCWDWYGAYTAGTLTDHRGAASGTNRVDRGGGWGSSASYATVAARLGNDPYDKGADVGFRVVRQ